MSRTPKRPPMAPGQRYGRLVAVEPADRNRHHQLCWRFRCDCGREHIAEAGNVKRGNTRSCGCLQREASREKLAKVNAARVPPMTPGQRYGRLVVVEPVRRDHHHNWYWLFRCDCGREHTAQANGVRFGRVKSCGCLHREVSTKHGMSRTNIYKIWAGMMVRCLNPEAQEFARYGGRGITVCERWRSFENFYADMGDRPSPRHSLDRINNNGNYEPGNCRWATQKEQMRNRSNNHMVILNGRRMTKAEALELIRIPSSEEDSRCTELVASGHNRS